VPLGNLLLVSGLSLGSLILLRRIVLHARGVSPGDGLAALQAAGAQIVDVRTTAEFDQGHASGSVNIPLDQVQARLLEIDPVRPVLLCCATGARAGRAKALLEQAGYARVHNAGSWTRFNQPDRGFPCSRP
jgi:rhodanese-related sulfurtransferase